MLLESPLFAGNLQQLNQKQLLIKSCIDTFLQMQSNDGNFPCVLEDVGKPEHKLVHWCHGAPGAVYVFAKSYLIFKEEKYLQAVVRAGELVWSKGLLKKGPGICHGVAGNGYVFLLLYRLTNDQKHLYRASCFANFLQSEIFQREALTPDRQFSLYEGIAGTICYLIDLLQPERASFPFMDVFETRY
jgi:lantibiotic modifying enzyme